MPSIYSSARTELAKLLIYGLFRKIRVLAQDGTANPGAPPRYELLPSTGPNSEAVGLATLPPVDPADVVFDIEGYPLVPGGLEYLFGARTFDAKTGDPQFHDWWAHTRDEETVAFESFIDWIHGRWKDNPAMHIYHFGAYDVGALRRLSTRHDTRQDEVDDLLRGNVFVDLYRVLRRGLVVGEQDYSLKSIERLVFSLSARLSGKTTR